MTDHHWKRTIRTALTCLALGAALLARPAPAGAQTPEQVYEKVVAALEPLLLGETSEKIAAAQELKKLRAVYSVPALEKALEDPSAKVRMAVVQALGAIVHGSSVKLLVKASSDEDVSVGVTAVKALGEMHSDEAYAGLTKLLGTVKEDQLKEAVLDGMRKWNKPFTPLPAPNTLPGGKKKPKLPQPEVEEPPPPVVEKKPEKKPGKKPVIKVEEIKSPGPKKPLVKVEKIEPIEPPAVKTVPAVLAPDVDGARLAMEAAAPDVADCILEWEVTPPAVPVQAIISTGGHMSELYFMRDMAPEATSCMHEVISGIEFPPASQNYSIDHKFTAEAAEVEAEGESPAVTLPAISVTPPPLTLDLWDLTRAGSVSFQATTASVGQGEGRVYSFKLRGGYLGKYIGGGVIIPFSGASDPSTSANQERVVFNNLGLWLRVAGAREVGSVELRFGGAVTINLPTATKVNWDDWGGIDKFYLPAMGALYSDYYNHGRAYPDLQDTFKVSIRPDVDFGVRIGMLSFQLELGLDFIVLGEAYNPDPFWQANMDMDELYLFHLGFGAALQPLSWLQLGMELTSVIELSGVSGQTWGFNRDEVGDPPGSEAFITPTISVLLPAGEAGSGHLTLGLRVPLGEVGSRAGSIQLDPILIVATGFRFH
jgi:hypothetical protein